MNRALTYLLDTDMCIYLLNGNSQVKQHVALAGVESLAVSIVTLGELYFGAHNSMRVQSNIQRVRAFVTPPGPQVIRIDDASAELFGKYKADLRKQGKPVADFDLLIAATANSNGLKLVTNNTAHFERIPGISLENWFEPLSSSNR